MALPCSRGLTGPCFRAYPEWTRQAFAYRLLHLLAPPILTRRLPRDLNLPFIHETVVVPPGVEIPPGTVVPPGTEIPPDWQHPSNPPEGVTIPPGATFPPGWQPGDELPLGAAALPGVEWPKGWTPSPTANQSGLIVTPIFASTTPTFMPPPQNQQQFGPGPTHKPVSTPPKPGSYRVYSGSNDGRVNCAKKGWATTHDFPTGTNVFATLSEDGTAMVAYWGGVNASIARAFVEFDLSSIPASRVVSSAVLWLKGYLRAQTDIAVQEGTQGATLSTADYQAFAAPLLGSCTWVVGTNSITLNADGIAYVQAQLGGTAKFCLREYEHDYLDVSPAVGENWRNGLYMSETPLDDDKPYIVVWLE